jgi:hypothetical protein
MAPVPAALSRIFGTVIRQTRASAAQADKDSLFFFTIFEKQKQAVTLSGP